MLLVGSSPGTERSLVVFRSDRHGVMVQQEDASIARWRFGCDSGHRRAALVAPLEKYGPVVQWQRHLVHTQETMVRFHPGPLRLGRQLADHLGLEPGMLWVRLPPEPLRTITNKHGLVEQPGVLACLSRRRSWVQIPSGSLK